MEDAIAGARAFVAGKPPTDRLAVGTFGNEAVALTGFSTSTIDADSALGALAVDPIRGTELYDAIVLGAEALAPRAEPVARPDRPDGRRGLGQRRRPRGSRLRRPVRRRQRLRDRHHGQRVLARAAPPARRRRPAERYYGTPSTEALTQIYAAIGEELRRTWLMEYATRARPGETLALEVTASGESATSEIKAPGVAAPTVETPKSSPLLPDVFYKSAWGSQLLAGTVGLIILMACIFLFAAPKGAWLRGRLKPHVAAAERDRRRTAESERLAFASPIFRATEHAFGKFGLWKRVDWTLKRADVPLKAVELVYAMIASGLALGLLATLVGPPIYVVGAVIGAGALIPYFVVSYLARRRLRAFENQLPDLLVTMAASLKAGHSFRQGIQSVVDEGQEPAAKEFKRVLTETRLGRPMDDAMGEMGQRMGSKNFEFVMSAVTIQRQVGGSLAGLFDMVADTVRQRHQFQRKIKGLTAMGRASAYVLVGLPFFVFFAISVIDRDYMDPLFETSTGNKLIIATFVMMAIGSAILKKIVSFKG